MEDEVEPTKPQNTGGTLTKWRIAGLIFVAVMVLTGVLVWSSKHTASPKSVPTATNEIPKSVISAVNFPIYYPASLPAGYELSDARAQGSIVNIYYRYATSKQLIITEQPRPLNIEEVTKTKEFTTPIGPAYLANLNGRTAGFVRADKTLIILTSSADITTSDLEQVMMNLQQAH